MSFDLTVDHYTQDKESGGAKVTRHTPFLRVRVEENPPMFLRNGNVFDESGELHRPETWPGWLEEELKKTSDASLASVGFVRDGGRIISISKAAKAKKE